MAKVVSIATLITIVVSSLGFILSTVPELQEVTTDDSAPKPGPAFDVIENICLAIFVVEYLVRLCSCPTVRSEVCDKEVLLEIATGYERIKLSTPAERTLNFVFGFSNIIDLAAILPGVVTIVIWIFTQKAAGNGGGFVVLRLVRLTRIFRAFRIGKYMESVVIIGRTVKQSTKALYVLGFNLLLGVVIFGSLMYLLEGGLWDPEIQAYTRKVDRYWNATLNEYVDQYGRSPWYSIPQSFWWALVTSAGVGYGDNSNIPTTPNGKLVATICMVWSLVILALPVGVIGGTFNKVWHEYAKNKNTETAALRREMVYVASAVQRMQPHAVSCLVMLEVWGDDGADESCMPMNPEGFMGEAKCELELLQDQPVSRELKLRLGSDGCVCKREVSGFIFVRYDWMPDPSSPPRHTKAQGTKLCLHGTLRFHILAATGLLNTDWSHSGSKSSPFVVMLCYPTSPSPEQKLVPVVWRSHIASSSLSPRWDCGRTFDYLWYHHCEEERDGQEMQRQSSSSPASLRKEANRQSIMQNSARMASSLSSLTAHLPNVTAGIEKLKDEVQRLTNRVDQLQSSTAQHFGGEDAAERLERKPSGMARQIS